MQLDRTRIVVRERSVLDTLDLALHVLRAYLAPLLVTMALGAVPLMVVNHLLIGWMLPDTDNPLDVPVRYLWHMTVLLFLEAPLASVFATQYLGQAVFLDRPRLRQVVRDVLKRSPQIVWCQILVRGAGAAWLLLLAADRYGLEVVARDIADSARNLTRFVLVGAEVPAPTGWDKTSMVVFIDTNKPGALLKLLEIFAERDLNLTKIESRPTKDELGEYCFFLDVEGHLADERVGDALAAVKRTHRDVKVLGSYRRSGARRTDEAERIHADDAAYREAAAWLAAWRTRVTPTSA